MLENSALYSRVLFVSALVCTAVMSFIMCSDAARASPITTQVDKVLRRLHTPHSRRHPLLTGQLSTETGLQSGTNGETEMSGNHREPSSIIKHQSHPSRFTGGSFSYSQNIPDNRQYGAGVTGVQSEVRPTTSIFTQHGQQSSERWHSRLNYHPLSREVARSGNSYNSRPVIVRKSSHKEAAGPFHQSSSPLQVFHPKDAQKSYNEGKVPRNVSPNVAEDKTVWQPADSSLFSAQTGRHWGASLPTSRGHYSGFKKTDELAGPRSASSGIQSSKFLSFPSQAAPRAPSISDGLDASVIKSNPSREKLASSITDFSHRSQAASSGDTPRRKQVQSYLFKDSQSSASPHKQRPSIAQVSSNFKQSQREEPTKEAQYHPGNANSLFHNANMARYGAQTDRFTTNQHPTTNTPTQISVYQTPRKDKTRQSLVSTPHADFRDNHIRGGEKSGVSSLVNATTRGSMHAYKPERTTKSIYGFRGFKSPTWRAVKEASTLSSSSSHGRNGSGRYSFHRGKFTITNKYPSLTQKYSFEGREVSITPAKLEKTPEDHSTLSPGTSDIVQTVTPPRPRFKETRPLLPGSDAGMDGGPDRRQFRIQRRKMYGLKGFGPTRPLEGAKPSAGEEGESSSRFQQGFAGFKGRGSQTWQPRGSSIQRWYNKSQLAPTGSRNEQSKEEAVARLTPNKHGNNRKIYTHLGFHPIPKRAGNATNKTPWRFKGQNPTLLSASLGISSAYLRSRGLRVESGPRFREAPLNKTKPVAMKASLLNSATSSTVRGKLVKGKSTDGKKPNNYTSLHNGTQSVAIVRLPKRPARVKAVTYADILGSASFTGVRATSQTPITPADKDYFPNATAATEPKEGAGQWTLNSEDAVQSGNDTIRGPELHEEDEGGDPRSAEDNLRVRGEGADIDVRTFGLFLDEEGSGSGGFNMSDIFAETTKRQGLSEDLLELDYLRTSTGNISFKSMKLPQSEKQEQCVELFCGLHQ